MFGKKKAKASMKNAGAEAANEATSSKASCGGKKTGSAKASK